MLVKRCEHFHRRLFLQSATGLTAVLATSLAPPALARAGADNEDGRIAVVDTRFDDALPAARRLHADTYIGMGARPDAFSTWRGSLQGNMFSRVCGVTTFSDYQILRNCLERGGYHLSSEEFIQGRATLVIWSLNR